MFNIEYYTEKEIEIAVGVFILIAFTITLGCFLYPRTFGEVSVSEYNSVSTLCAEQPTLKKFITEQNILQDNKISYFELRKIRDEHERLKVQTIISNLIVKEK